MGATYFPLRRRINLQRLILFLEFIAHFRACQKKERLTSSLKLAMNWERTKIANKNPHLNFTYECASILYFVYFKIIFFLVVHFQLFLKLKKNLVAMILRSN